MNRYNYQESRYWISISKLIILAVLSYSNVSAQTVNIDYFGLKEPDTTAFLFNPSVLNLEGGFVFNAVFNVPICDEFYYTRVDSKENIYLSKKVNGIWQSPVVAPFSDRDYHDADPFFALEGQRVYFVSSRPTHPKDNIFDYNIWYADRNEMDWHQPQVLPEPINSGYEEYFFSISNKGNAFFASNRPGGIGSFDIYTLQILPDGKLSDPVNIGEPLNTKGYEFDPYISPDENFIVFSINDDRGLSDIYFSYKNKNAEWMPAINLGNKINTPNLDFGPSISPDNKYLFYMNGGVLKWISIDILDSYR